MCRLYYKDWLRYLSSPHISGKSCSLGNHTHIILCVFLILVSSNFCSEERTLCLIEPISVRSLKSFYSIIKSVQRVMLYSTKRHFESFFF